MPRGRRPTPTKVLKLIGSSALRKRRHKHKEPEAPPGEPSCPSFLDAVGKRAWKTLVTTLKDLKLLSKADQMLMGILCQEWALYSASSKAVNRFKRAEAWAEARKAQAIANDASRNVFKAAQEFGLGPSARTRIDVPAGGKDEDEFSAFLNKRGA